MPPAKDADARSPPELAVQLKDIGGGRIKHPLKSKPILRDNITSFLIGLGGGLSHIIFGHPPSRLLRALRCSEDEFRTHISMPRLSILCFRISFLLQCFILATFLAVVFLGI